MHFMTHLLHGLQQMLNTMYPCAEAIPNDGIDHNCYSEDLIRTDIAERKPFIAKLFPNPSDGLALLH
jgi:hypothetical protein